MNEKLKTGLAVSCAFALSAVLITSFLGILAYLGRAAGGANQLPADRAFVFRKKTETNGDKGGYPWKTNREWMLELGDEPRQIIIRGLDRFTNSASFTNIYIELRERYQPILEDNTNANGYWVIRFVP